MSALSLKVYTSEWEPGRRHVMIVGETGTANVYTETEDCFIFEPPCSASVDVELRSSDPAVVAPARQRIRTPGYVELIAHAAGTAELTATVGGHSASERIDVVNAPLPLDAVQVTLDYGWNDLPVEYDASESLSWVAVPTGQSGALKLAALRSGTRVYGIPFAISSSAPGVALGTLRCRPETVDPHCDTAYEAWITGMAPGDAQITISARNISTTFTAHVVPAP